MQNEAAKATQNASNLIIHLNIICCRNVFRVRSCKQKQRHLKKRFWKHKKQFTKTTVHWNHVKRFGYKATIMTCGDGINNIPKKQCRRYVPGEAEARKNVAAMKETSLYTSNIDAIATSFASASENISVQLSMPEENLAQEHSIATAKKQHYWYAGLTSHQNVQHTQRIQLISHIRLRHRRPKKSFEFWSKDATKIVRHHSTPMVCWLNL